MVFLPSLYSITELPKIIFLRALTFIALGLFCYQTIKTGKLGWVKIDRKFWISLAIFVFANLLALFFSINPHLSFWGSYERQQGFLQLIFYVILFLLFISFFDKKSINKLLKIICCTASVIALFAIFQNFIPLFGSFWKTEILLGRLSIGTLGHPNFLASYLLMLIPFVVITFFGKRDFWHRVFWGICGLTILIAIILTRSREAYLGLFIMSVLGSLIYKRKLLIIPILVVLVVMAINVFAKSNFVKSNVFLHRLVINDEQLIASEPRFAIWPAVIKQIKERPLLGYGQEVFSESFAKFTPNKLLKIEAFRSVADRAHNEVLDSASSTGILGLLSYLFLLGYLILICVKNLKNPYVAASLLSFVGLFTSNMFGFSATSNYLMWWLLAGVVIVLSGKKTVISIGLSINSYIKKFVYLFLVCLLFLAIYFGGIKPLIADYHFSRANIYSDYLLHFYALDEFKKASIYNPMEATYPLRAADYLIIAAKNNREPYYRNILLIQAEWFLNRAKKLAGGDYSKVLYLKGKLYSAFDDNALASEFFEKAYLKIPKNPDLLLSWADSLNAQEKYDEALAIYVKFLKLAPYWDEAFTVEQSSPENQRLFRLFFKHNVDFPGILEKISECAQAAGHDDESKKYHSYAQKIKEVMKDLTSELGQLRS